MPQRLQDGVNEPRRAPVGGGANCQGASFSLISSEEMTLLITERLIAGPRLRVHTRVVSSRQTHRVRFLFRRRL